MRVRNEKMSLEGYIDFLLSHKQIDLTANFLNQIITIHGFKRIHKVQKKVLTDALDTVDLIDPSRSTLNETISSSACITLEDIMEDLSQLNWQECCVTSIQTLNSSKHNDFQTAADHELSVPKLKREQKKKKKKRVNGGGFYGVDDGGGVDGGDSAWFYCGLGATKLVPKRKRSGVVRTRGGGGGGGSSSGLVSFGSC